MRNVIWLVLLFAVAVVAALTFGDNDGLVRTWTYHTSTGYMLTEKIQRGELGTTVIRQERM